ncbi:hypothetical protein GF380_06555 [Candidatus Uhrbacteria bacterium]|nr:hypothetical protein [Candidatus Uhrbacteria bacterium]MBD3284595.1 hypothetical protein [Candidatus Uhrbacteria bacterium]
MTPLEIKQLQVNIQKRYEEAGVRCPNLQNMETLWAASIYTTNGTTPILDRTFQALALAVSDPRTCPWGKDLRKLRPDPEHPRILILGRPCKGGLLTKQQSIDEVAATHGFTKPRITLCTHLIQFWPSFLGKPAFFTDSVDLPSLILSPGSTLMDAEPYDTPLEISGLLEKLRNDWEIPHAIIHDA